MFLYKSRQACYASRITKMVLQPRIAPLYCAASRCISHQNCGRLWKCQQAGIHEWEYANPLSRPHPCWTVQSNTNPNLSKKIRISAIKRRLQEQAMANRRAISQVEPWRKSANKRSIPAFVPSPIAMNAKTMMIMSTVNLPGASRIATPKPPCLFRMRPQ